MLQLICDLLGHTSCYCNMIKKSLLFDSPSVFLTEKCLVPATYLSPWSDFVASHRRASFLRYTPAGMTWECWIRRFDLIHYWSESFPPITRMTLARIITRPDTALRPFQFGFPYCHHSSFKANPSKNQVFSPKIKRVAPHWRHECQSIKYQQGRGAISPNRHTSGGNSLTTGNNVIPLMALRPFFVGNCVGLDS